MRATWMGLNLFLGLHPLDATSRRIDHAERRRWSFNFTIPPEVFQFYVLLLPCSPWLLLRENVQRDSPSLASCELLLSVQPVPSSPGIELRRIYKVLLDRSITDGLSCSRSTGLGLCEFISQRRRATVEELLTAFLINTEEASAGGDLFSPWLDQSETKSTLANIDDGKYRRSTLRGMAGFPSRFSPASCPSPRHGRPRTYLFHCGTGRR